MQNDMRDRLVELIQNAVDGCASYWAELIADHLIANGVVLPPCKVGDVVWTKMKLDSEVKPFLVTEIKKDSKGVPYFTIVHITKYGCKHSSFFYYWDFGKTVFRTKKQAEQKLKELSGNAET